MYMMSFKEYFNRPQVDETYLRKLAESGNSPELEVQMEAVFNALAGEGCDIDGAFASISSRLPKRRNSRLRRSCLMAMACAASICLGVVLTKLSIPANNPVVEWEEVRVPQGETRNVALADGTVISLNSGSRLTYPSTFSDSVRSVFLEGEAILRVAKNPEHPFIVKSGDMSIRVLGTTFSIKSYHDSDCEEVLLMEGAVALDIEGHKTVNMYPGNMVHYRRSMDKVDVDNFDVSSFRGFDQGRAIHFFNMPLSEIALDLERIFDTRIIIADSALEESTFFAIFNNGESLYDILRVLNTEKKMKMERKDKTIYITSN